MHTSFTAMLAGHVWVLLAAAKQSRTALYQTNATAYCSNADRSYKLSPIPGPVPGLGYPNGQQTWNLSIVDTPGGCKQTITGFGAAVTDATVASMNTLPPDQLSRLLNELMTSDGSNFSLMRHTIASSDMSADPAYSYDDNGGHADPSLSGFSLGDPGTAMASLLARMQSINPDVKILGSPWSPPGWMKLNGVLDGTTYENNLNDGYLNHTGPFYSDQFAQYFVDYLQAYRSLGAHVDAITIQNEPLNSQAGYPTMYVFAGESGMLIQDFVGPALKSANLATEVWAWDHNTDVPQYPQTVLLDAGDYVDTVAWHCYANPLDWGVLTQFHENNPNVTQYMSECWTPDPSSGYYSWFQAANFTIGPLQNWASGALAWTLAGNSSNGPYLSTGGCQSACRGLVTVNDNGTYTLNIDYYMMAQFSKFIPRGASILEGTGSWTFPDGGIQSVASLNPDGTRTVVMMNTFPDARWIYLSTASGQQWSGSVPGNSVVNWILPISVTGNQK